MCAQLILIFTSSVCSEGVWGCKLATRQQVENNPSYTDLRKKCSGLFVYTPCKRLNTQTCQVIPIDELLFIFTNVPNVLFSFQNSDFILKFFASRLFHLHFQNIHLKEPPSYGECTEGCECREGFILDTQSNTCVRDTECPCHFGGKSYNEGDVVRSGCNRWYELNFIFYDLRRCCNRCSVKVAFNFMLK